MAYDIILGDCLEIMKTLPDNSKEYVDIAKKRINAVSVQLELDF